MQGWQHSPTELAWYGYQCDSCFIVGSCEPSGLVLEAKLDHELWVGWISQICAKLSLALAHEVCDAEM